MTNCNKEDYIKKTYAALEGVKYDNGKARFDLIPPDALFDLAEVYTYGANKYADRNWEKGMAWGRIFGALMRHSWAMWSGEDLDKESKLPHMSHVAWCALTLLSFRRRAIGVDDRSKVAMTAQDSCKTSTATVQPFVPPVIYC